jgi:malate synthase
LGSTSDLVPLAMTVFDQHMPAKPNSCKTERTCFCNRNDLLETQKEPSQRRSKNISISVYHIASLARPGAATASFGRCAASQEISRSQLWQWLQTRLHARKRKTTKAPITTIN